MFFRSILSATLLMLPVAAMSQSFGVVELNALTVTNGNSAIGDVTPGAPITINVPGHYRLSSDLFTPKSTAIEVDLSAGAITIDLNGFTIKSGAAVCSSTSNNIGCPAPGIYHGINRVGSGHTALVVSNGTIERFAGDGVRCLGTPCNVRNITVLQNHGWGINIAQGSVDGVLARFNGFGGILNSLGAVSKSTAYNNGNRGIVARTLTDVLVDLTFFGLDNGPFGAIAMVSGDNVTVTNTAGGVGIIAGGHLNNSNASGNQGVGILANGSVSRSTANGNQTGFDVQSGGVVRDSVATGNSIADLVGNPISGLNICSGTVC